MPPSMSWSRSSVLQHHPLNELEWSPFMEGFDPTLDDAKSGPSRGALISGWFFLVRFFSNTIWSSYRYSSACPFLIAFLVNYPRSVCAKKTFQRQPPTRRGAESSSNDRNVPFVVDLYFFFLFFILFFLPNCYYFRHIASSLQQDFRLLSLCLLWLLAFPWGQAWVNEEGPAAKTSWSAPLTRTRAESAGRNEASISPPPVTRTQQKWCLSWIRQDNVWYRIENLVKAVFWLIGNCIRYKFGRMPRLRALLSSRVHGKISQNVRDREMIKERV